MEVIPKRGILGFSFVEPHYTHVSILKGRVAAILCRKNFDNYWTSGADKSST